MERDLDCMLDGGARISVFESFLRSMLSYVVEYCHEAQRLHLSAFLCVYCEQWFSCPLQTQHKTVQYFPSGHDPATARGWTHLSPQNSVNITLHTLGFLDPVGWSVLPLHASTSACSFIVIHPRVITCHNLLHENLFSLLISLQKLHALSHVCLKLLWRPPCTNFVMLEVLVDYGIRRSLRILITRWTDGFELGNLRIKVLSFGDNFKFS